MAEEKGIALPQKDELENIKLKALADHVVEVYSDLDNCLGKHRFPIVEFNRFWQAVYDYSAAMKEFDWLHRNVAGIVNGLHDYLELESHKAPSDIWWKIDQMEVLLFSGYNAYPEHGRPNDLGDSS
jgi:hypothetical protein